jgi:TolB-like protein
MCDSISRLNDSRLTYTGKEETMQVSAVCPEVSSFVASPSESDVRAQLERILASADFQGQHKRGALLRYLVEETLAGRGYLVKGFTIANAVFGRGVSFDGQSDAVVRLAARRLRTAIDVYYGTTGAHDPLRISIPKGHYRALFEWREDVSADPLGRVSDAAEHRDLVPAGVPRMRAPQSHAAHSPRSSRSNGRALVVLLCGVTMATGISAWTMRRPDANQSHAPAIMVLPFEALGAKADDRFLASGITQELITDLMHVPGLRVYSVPATLPGSTNTEAAVLKNELGGAHVVSGNVASSTSLVRLGVHLADARTGEILWSETYDREMTPGALLAVRGDLAAKVATVLAERQGVVGKHLALRSASGTIHSMRGSGSVRGAPLASMATVSSLGE